MSFGQFLKDYRKKKDNMSISELHRITGVSQPYLSQIEQGKKPSAKIVKKISETIHQDYYKLMNLAGYLDDEEYEKYEKNQYQLIDSAFHHHQAKKKEEEIEKKIKENSLHDELSSIEEDEEGFPNFYLDVGIKFKDDKKTVPHFSLRGLLAHKETSIMYDHVPLDMKQRKDIMKFIENFIINKEGD